MANTLTNLIPDMYAALQVVSRERVGFLPAVMRDGTTERAAVGQTVRVPVVPADAPIALTAAVTEPDDGDQALDNVTVSITNGYTYPIRWTGEEARGLTNAGTFGGIVQRRFEQAFRAIGNMVEADLASLYKFASRAYGTAGTTPFGTADNLTDLSKVRQILAENGAPPDDLHLVLSLAATANLTGLQPTAFRANEAFGQGDSARLSGSIGRLMGFTLHESGQITQHTKGTASGYLVDLVAGYDEGDTSIHLDTGTGTHVAGDVVVFEGDANKYVVNTGAAGDGDKDIVIGEPGLRAALADGKTVTTGNSYTPNLAFSSDAIVLAARLPAIPPMGDGADDRTVVTDPVSGLSFDVAHFGQFFQGTTYVSLVWGQAVVNPAHVAILLG